MSDMVSREAALLTGCRPCGYMLKCILCLSPRCSAPLAKRLLTGAHEGGGGGGGGRGGGGGGGVLAKNPVLENDAD